PTSPAPPSLHDALPSSRVGMRAARGRLQQQLRRMPGAARLAERLGALCHLLLVLRDRQGRTGNEQHDRRHGGSHRPPPPPPPPRAPLCPSTRWYSARQGGAG